MTPPKDKPVVEDKEVPSDQDNIERDEAVAETEMEKDASSDLNVNNSEIGLNKDQGEEFL
ncbi:hypothetical protein [Pedobacter sp. JCM 36344]|uniref:hypothetical protein n=1 Tax=Pedobacter sp. JCM 36344 TaxID=3374280 RepID=UPI0039795B85